MPSGSPPYAGAPMQYPFSDSPGSGGRSGKAVAGFVLGLVSIVLFITLIIPILAIVFGLLGAKEIKGSAGQRTGLAMARIGWILGVLGLVGGGVLLAFIGNEIAGTTAVSELKVGQCVDLPGDGVDEVARLDTQSCDEPHEAEVFSVGDLGDGSDPYPGADEIDQLIAEQCIPDFEAYIGTPYGEGDLDVYRIYPLESDWDNYQGYQCLVFLTSREQLTETVEDSGR